MPINAVIMISLVPCKVPADSSLLLKGLDAHCACKLSLYAARRPVNAITITPHDVKLSASMIDSRTCGCIVIKDTGNYTTFNGKNS